MHLRPLVAGSHLSRIVDRASLPFVLLPCLDRSIDFLRILYTLCRVVPRNEPYLPTLDLSFFSRYGT